MGSGQGLCFWLEDSQPPQVTELLEVSAKDIHVDPGAVEGRGGYRVTTWDGRSVEVNSAHVQSVTWQEVPKEKDDDEKSAGQSLG